jgi:hypothetical protein
MISDSKRKGDLNNLKMAEINLIMSYERWGCTAANQGGNEVANLKEM